MRHAQDAMAIVRAFGKPDIFLTMTCNPKWPEILAALLPGQTASDRPDLSTRVFRLKLKALLSLLFTKGVIGRSVAHIHVVEFQKRGLPHAHLLIILAPEDKPRGPVDYDTLISAEIPDPATHPLLYETVSTCMMHGPCGPVLGPKSPCMDKEGKCSKRFPKQFSEETCESTDGYPIYRR